MFKKALWQGLTCVFALFVAIAVMAATLLESFRSIVDGILGTQSEITVTEETDTIYDTFTPPADVLDANGKTDTRALIKKAIDLSRRQEAEGIVMLKNDNAALPLKTGSNVTLLGYRSSALILNSGMGQKSQGCYISLEQALSATKTDFANTKIGSESSGNVTYPETINDYNFSELKYGGNGAEAGAGFKVNPTMSAIYGKQDARHIDLQPAAGSNYDPKEIPVAQLAAENADYKKSFADYNDAAIVVVGRGAGESNDYLKGSLKASLKTDKITEPLQLTQDELDTIKLAKDNFSKVIVLVNCNSAMEIGDLKNDKDIDAILWVGNPGNYGTLGIADVLCGKANPSGGLYDIYATNNLSAPAMQNMGDYTFANGSDITRKSSNKYIMEAEGLYVGYRYYETRYYDSIVNPGSKATSTVGAYASKGAWDYDAEVAYGFGYGLSYTDFSYKMVGAPKFTQKPHEIYVDVTVEVTNTGKVAGKTPVQIYAQAPYTAYDIANGVEKSAIQLVNFGKTGIIEPGKSEKVTVTLDLTNLASYDMSFDNGDGTKGTYILEEGDYYFAVGNGAHDALNNVLAAQGYGNDKLVGTGNASLAYKWNYDYAGSGSIDNTTFGITKNNVQVSNHLETSDWSYFQGASAIKHLSRSNWEATYPEEYKNMTAPASMLSLLNGNYYEFKKDTEKETWESKTTDYKFYEMKLSDWNDARWNDLLNQLVYSEAFSFCYLAGPTLLELSTIDFQKIVATDNAGNGLPFVISTTNFGTKDNPFAVSPDDVNAGWNGQIFGCAPIVASTFNPDIMFEIGEFVAIEAIIIDQPIIWGPGLNTHRHAYNGRNGEYYSEDPVLSGVAAMEFSIAARDNGLIAAPKHFAFNDQETNRQGVAPFLTEQRAREIELRAFQIAIEATKYDQLRGEDTGMIGLMTSFSKLGPVEITAHEGMLNYILQQEWGFHGYAVSDIFDDTDLFPQTIVAGLTGFDMRGTSAYDSKAMIEKYGDDLYLQQSVKTSVKRTLWALSQSNLMNRYAASTHKESQMTWWRAAYIAAISVTSVLTVASAALYTVSAIKNKED